MNGKPASLLAAIFSAAFLLGSLAPPANAAGDDPPAWRDRQEIWWDEDRLVKNAIVQALNYRVMRPETDYDAAYGVSSNAIYEMILLFDGRGDSRTLRTLADLVSYRLDGAAGEILSCVIQRKGRAMLPAFEEQLAKGGGDCLDAKGIDKRMCRNEEEYRSEVQSYIRAIKAGDPCYIER